MAVARRLCALVVALALGLAAPLGAPRGCVSCPPGCPMHARAEAGGAETREATLGCHRRPVPAGQVCLRSACGRDAITVPAVTLRAVLAPPAAAVGPLAGVPLATPVFRLASALTPEPPTRPPRSARV
jgi:hypothetical protein